MQQINLYQAQFKPKKIWLPPRQMFLVLLVVLIALAIVSVYSAQKSAVLDKTIASQQQHAVQQLELVKEDPLLNAELKKLLSQKQTKEKLLNYLTQNSFGNQSGFSKALHDLAQQKVENVWLTDFSLLNGGQSLVLRGKALKSDQIPLFIDSLIKAEHFRQRQFSEFQLQQLQDDDGIYSFSLQSSGQQQSGGLK